jgi:putative PEP-CTERM system histidine kinase
MNITVWIAFGVAVLVFGVAAMALQRDRRAFVNYVFATGMVLFALMAVCIGLAWTASIAEDFLFWVWCRFAVASFVPGVFLLFSLSFARLNYGEQISRWKWILALAFVLPVSLLSFFRKAFFTGIIVPTGESAPFIQIGWSGYLWHLVWLGFSVLILMNLERTFRHTTGHIRWQTKFMFLGLAAVFCIQIYTHSQVVTFKVVNTALDIVDVGALLVGTVLILRSLLRGRLPDVSVYLSHKFLYNSFTVLIVGIYFIAVSVTAWISIQFEWIKNVHIVIFLIFTAVIGIAVFQLSDRLRIKRKRFISHHFKRQQYDYQKIWSAFTVRTASVTQTHDLCDVIVRMVSETLEILSVSIWILDEKQERFFFGGSTVWTEKQAKELKVTGQDDAALVRAMADQTYPVDLREREDDWAEDLKKVVAVKETKESRIRYCVPLEAAGRLVGIMTLSEKVFYEPLSFEELELIKTLADQAAASLLNLQLAQRLRRAKEMEAFQSMSAFFMHDLKNLASKLSLVTRNLPVYMDDPEFRADAIKTISQSVAKINGMSSRLSLFSRNTAPDVKETDVNQLIADTIDGLKETVRAPITQNLGKMPRLFIDSDQIHKVLENLMINASESLGLDGEISVATRFQDNLAEILVRDNGCGISLEFMEKNLFRPFQTTKKQGMGIGLYHCKTIVEAHGGRIEVESQEGHGTTFKVVLPIRK